MTKTQKRNLRRRLAIRRGEKPKRLLDFDRMSETLQKKHSVYAKRSVEKEFEHNISRPPEAEDPIVIYLFNRTFNNVNNICSSLDTCFYRFHEYLNKYFKTTQDGKDCYSPVAEEGAFHVVTKINISFDTIMCYVVDKVYVIEPEDDLPATQAPNYIFESMARRYYWLSLLRLSVLAFQS